MKAFRAGLFPLAAVAMLFGWQQPARADVRMIRAAQSLPQPTPSYKYLEHVAIDGAHLIVIGINDATSQGAGNTYAALLYRRNLSDGKWVFRRALVTTTGYFTRMEVRMRNQIAVVNFSGYFGGQAYLFEYSNGDYRPASVSGPLVHAGGVAISQQSVLFGGNDCDYDGAIYQKGADGVWSITGRINDNTGECDPEGLDVSLSYDYALVRSRYSRVVKAWRRSGTAVNWIRAGDLSLPQDTPLSDEPYVLQGATAVSNGGHVWRRSGTSTWNFMGRATSVENDNSFGITFGVGYRDGVMVTSESGRGRAFPRVYQESSPGHFEHVASLYSLNGTGAFDVSGNTVAVIVRDLNTTAASMEVFTLPTPLHAPPQIVNDFEDRQTTEFTFNSGQFALATRGSDDVLAQRSGNTLAIALVTDSDWSDYQRVEADITPTFNAGDSWAGLIARYVDPNNYYFAVIRANRTYSVYKRVNGVNTPLLEGSYYPTSTGRVSLAVDASDIFLMIDNQYFPVGTDRSLTHGRAGLATWQARADFDDVQVAATPEYGYFYREWGPTGSDIDIDLTLIGGHWHVLLDEQEYNQGLAQDDKSGNAVGFVGTPVANQEVTARVRLASFGDAPQNAWFGLLARYVDAQNQYYVTARSNGKIEIRKIVNGNITVLASANLTVVPQQQYELRFRLINDELQLFVDNVMVASAHDTSIPSGKYGLATYRTSVIWDYLYVQQP